MMDWPSQGCVAVPANWATREFGSTFIYSRSDLPMAGSGLVTLDPVASKPAVALSLWWRVERQPDERYDREEAACEQQRRPQRRSWGHLASRVHRSALLLPAHSLWDVLARALGTDEVRGLARIRRVPRLVFEVTGPHPLLDGATRSLLMTRGTVAFWHSEEGWGAIAAPDRPGVGFVQNVQGLEGYRDLIPGSSVEFK